MSAGHGEELSDKDIMRLTRRFDDYGDGVCSVTKFTQCVERSRWWQQGKERVEQLADVKIEAERAAEEGMELGEN